VEKWKIRASKCQDAVEKMAIATKDLTPEEIICVLHIITKSLIDDDNNGKLEIKVDY